MKPFAFAFLFAAAVAQAQMDPAPPADGHAGVQITVGWEGDYPVGWEGWSLEVRTQHEARLQAAKAELTVYIDAAHAQRLDTQWDVEVSYGLYRRSVNAGFSAEASMDLVKTFVVENTKREDAEKALKTAATEATTAEKDNTDAADKETEFKNLGQWVKAHVHGGLHGEELADAIHAKIKARHEQKMADKAAGKDGKADDGGLGTGQGDDHGRGHGNGNGGGDDHGQGHGEGHGHGHGPK